MTCPEKDLLKLDFSIKAQLLIHVLAEQGLFVQYPLLHYESGDCYISFDEFNQIFEVLNFYDFWAVNRFLRKALLGIMIPVLIKCSKCGCHLIEGLLCYEMSV